MIGPSRWPRSIPQSPHGSASLASAESLRALIDKGRFARLLQQLGLPHPRTVLVENEGDWADVRTDAFVNAFLKPRDSQAFRRGYGVKGRRFETPSEAIALGRDAQRRGLDVMLQEYVPGPPTNHYMVEGFVDRTGRPGAAWTSAQWPTGTHWASRSTRWRPTRRNATASSAATGSPAGHCFVRAV
jgi:glutathione synthase/RimK-type ligase-like ATP-grasp enzyme